MDFSRINLEGSIYNVKDEHARNYLEELKTRIDSVASGSPLVVNSVSEMTDTSRVYVNTTDGNWYYYNGSSWVVGGVYQSSGIAKESITSELISSKAIDILKLDDYLQNTKLISYSDYLDLGELKEGFYINTNNIPQLVTSSDEYGHYEYKLTKDKIYQFNGYNISHMCGILVLDENNNPVYDSNKIVGDYDQTSIIFRVNQENLTAYISILKKYHDVNNEEFKNYWIRYNTPSLREVEKCINKYETLKPKKLYDLEKSYIDSTRVSPNNAPLIALYDGVDLQVYEMVKGVHYNIDSFNWSGVAGACVVDSNNKIIYRSSDENVGNIYELVNHDFIASDNGFIIVSERLDYKSNVTIVDEIENAIEEMKNSIIDEMKNTEYNFKKWYAIGDSITEKNFRALKNYVDYCSEGADIQVINLGMSGTGYKNTGGSNNNFETRLEQITEYDLNNEIITVMGSINDIEFVSDNLGQIGDETTDTIYGSIYTFFNSLFAKFTGCRVGLITPIPSGNSLNNETWENYKTALIETAKLFNVPVLDITNSCNLQPWDEAFRNEFFLSDGEGSANEIDDVHPNSKGHKLFYSKIKEFLKTL